MTLPSSRRRTSRPLTATLICISAAVGLSGCGRSAPDGALDSAEGDPEIAGISITSPDAIVEPSPTVAAAVDDTTTSTSIAAPSQGNLYIVQQGDTLSVIAKKHNVTIKELADLNGLNDVDTLALGQELLVPAPSSTTVTEPAADATTDDSGTDVEVSVVTTP